MKISLEKLTRAAAERPLGYFEEVIAAGIVRDGWLFIRPAALRPLLEKYSPERLQPKTEHAPRNTNLTGLGDAVALIAKPIARTIDKVAGTNLEKCGGCAKRQAKLNAVFPFQKS